MNRDLYIHTLQGMRDVFAHEHMDTRVESLDVAIWAIETQEQLQKERDAALAMAKMEMFVDGTLSITVADISQIRRVLVSQSDTQYGTLYYADGGKYDEGWKDGRKALREEMWEDEQSGFN